MFKFLKDKLKGALSTFSKKAEEVAKEEPVEVPEVAPAEPPAAEPATSSPERLTSSEKESTVKVDESKTSGGEEPAVETAEEKQETVEEAIEEVDAPEEPKEVPQITIPAEEKKSFFQRIKSVFVKEEAEAEIPAEEKKSDVEVLPNEPVSDVVIEEADIQVEGSPLRKVDIHRHDEHELPVIEKLFEPIEPIIEKPKKFEENPEDYVPAKVAARIKDIKVKDEPEKKSAKVPASSVSSPVRLKTEPKKSETKLDAKDEKNKDVGTPVVEEKKGFFSRLKEAVTTKKISETQFEDLFWDLEVALLENNVAVEVISKLKDDLKKALVDQPIPRGKIEATILATLKTSLEDLFAIPQIDLLEKIQGKKPYIICFVGINGSGKTTTIAKVTHLFQQHKLGVVLAAADTFRAAAIDQLQLHADKLGVKLIKHDYGSDPAAVAFDAIKHAEASKKDVVLIDTAGRLHSNINLVDEMKKIVRVAKPDLILFIGESITGNDCVEQAKQFNEAVGIDGIILSKADIDEKGGAAISVSYVTKKPILYLGVGQEYDDLQKFDSQKLLESLGL